MLTLMANPEPGGVEEVPSMKNLTKRMVLACFIAASAGACTTTDERISGAAAGAGAGVLVGGPIGAVAGGAIGAFSGPTVAKAFR